LGVEKRRSEGIAWGKCWAWYLLFGSGMVAALCGCVWLNYGRLIGVSCHN
jgi:hypothetical protein